MTTYNYIPVNLTSHYQILVGKNLYTEDIFSPYICGKQIFIVTNETIAPYYLTSLKTALQSYDCDTFILPDGEQYKTLASLEKIFDALLKKQHDRMTTLIALGGGVIGDLTGFAAACYRRGVPYLQCPTTLLAQVDSAIGGKTGVNHPLGKNMIGAIYQPSAVICDINTLTTLPDREYISGLAEVIKYSLLTDAVFFDWLEQHTQPILARDSSILIEMISRCANIKAHIVTKDEHEKNIRALLNLGHTFAHVFESLTHYKKWLHGEAVALGLVLAADISQREGYLSAKDYQRILKLIISFGLPTKSDMAFDPKQFFDYMFYDKKVLQQKLRLILLNKIGSAFISADFNDEIVKQTLEEHLN